MDIRLKGTAYPARAGDNVVAGLAVVMDYDATHTRPDVNIAARLPRNAADAATAFYVAEFPDTNQTPPIYVGLPSRSYSLRQGWDTGVNLPATGVTVRLTNPRLQEEQTIPSGADMLMYGEGIYAVPSGCYVDSASLVPGAFVEVDYGANAGKWKIYSAGVRLGQVIDKETVGKLVIKTFAQGF